MIKLPGPAESFKSKQTSYGPDGVRDWKRSASTIRSLAFPTAPAAQIRSRAIPVGKTKIYINSTNKSTM